MPNLTFAVSLIKRYVKVSAGQSFSTLLKTKRAYAWGTAALGQLGRNTATNQCSPLSVCGAIKTFCQISTGNAHTHVLDKYGRAWSWGNGANGKLGDNTAVNKSTPVSIAGAVKTFCQIAAGSNHGLAIEKNGRLWAWGINTNGRLGNNSTVATSTPVSVLGAVKTFCKINGSSNSSFAIDKNGLLWAWGAATTGALGDNSVVDKSTPVSVRGALKTFCKIGTVAGNNGGAIDVNGKAWMWGNNTVGLLGDNSTTARSTPVAVGGANKTFCKLVCGANHSLALDKYGKIWGWGNNVNGAIGDDSVTCRSTPVSVCLTATKTFCDIAAGTTHSLAVDKNSNVYAWGSNANGELGQGVTSVSPVSVRGNKKTFCSIDSGQAATSVIDKNGKIWSWGVNSTGQYGDNSVVRVTTPKSICGAVKTFCKILSGQTQKVAIDKNGRAWGWGTGANGVLGDGTSNPRSTPVSVAGAVKTFCHIGTYSNTAAIDKNGQVWTWGTGLQGCLGNNSTTAVCTPISICGAVKTFCKIAVGPFQVLAIDKNGRAWGWGQNAAGGIGNNSVVAVCTPVSVCGAVKTFCEIAQGELANFTAAIDKNGRAWCWGSGTNGALGNNGALTRSTPVSVCGAVKTFCKISCGSGHSLALDKYGIIWGWGQNAAYQLGDGTQTNRCTPVSLNGAKKTFCQIGAGLLCSVAIDQYGQAWAWGSNFNAELGIGFSNATPIKITTI